MCLQIPEEIHVNRDPTWGARPPCWRGDKRGPGLQEPRQTGAARRARSRRVGLQPGRPVAARCPQLRLRRLLAGGGPCCAALGRPSVPSACEDAAFRTPPQPRPLWALRGRTVPQGGHWAGCSGPPLGVGVMLVAGQAPLSPPPGNRPRRPRPQDPELQGPDPASSPVLPPRGPPAAVPGATTGASACGLQARAQPVPRGSSAPTAHPCPRELGHDLPQLPQSPNLSPLRAPPAPWPLDPPEQTGPEARPGSCPSWNGPPALLGPGWPAVCPRSRVGCGVGAGWDRVCPPARPPSCPGHGLTAHRPASFSAGPQPPSPGTGGGGPTFRSGAR